MPHYNDGAFPFPIESIKIKLYYNRFEIKSKFSTKRGKGMRPNLGGYIRKKEGHAF